MLILAVFLIFLLILFCINYTIIAIIINQKQKKEAKKKPIWENEIEKEIKRVLQE